MKTPTQLGFHPERKTDFQTTCWSIVLAARQSDDFNESEAWRRICRGYWYPLYNYVRRRGYNAIEAEDLTQSFFARFFEKNNLQGVCPSKGKFRAFLLAALKHFLDNEWRRMKTLKRGGDRRIVSWEAAAGEERFLQDRELPADMAYDRQWACNLVDRVLRELKEEYHRQGRGPLYDLLHACLSDETVHGPYACMAQQLGMSLGAVKMAVHRLRRRFGELLRLEVARTVQSPEEVDNEIRYLLSALHANPEL